MIKKISEIHKLKLPEELVKAYIEEDCKLEFVKIDGVKEIYKSNGYRIDLTIDVNVPL